MKAIVSQGDRLVTLDVTYYKTGEKPAGLRVGLMFGKVQYTVEDLGDYQCILRRYRPFHVGPIEETQMDIEYGTDNVLRLGLALTKQSLTKG